MYSNQLAGYVSEKLNIVILFSADRLSQFLTKDAQRKWAETHNDNSESPRPQQDEVVSLNSAKTPSGKPTQTDDESVVTPSGETSQMNQVATPSGEPPQMDDESTKQVGTPV